MAPHVVFIESNAKGGVRAQLTEKTLLVGPNGSGKGAVQNAVELALTGKVSDVQGRREIAKEIDLISHLSPDARTELLARAVLSDGTECVWRAGGKSKKASHTFPPMVDPALALPLRPVYAAITGAADTARKFFLEYAVGAITDRDVLARIPPSLHPFYNRATLASTLSTQTAVDRLLAALERAKKLAKEAKDRAKATRSVADENAQGLAPLPTEAEEKAMKAAVKEAEQRVEAVKRLIAQAEALAGIGEKLADARRVAREAQAEFDAAVAAEQAANATLAGIPVPPDDSNEVKLVVASMRAHAVEKRTDCLVCGSVGPHDFAGRLARVEAWLSSVVEQSSAHRKAREGVAAATERRLRAYDRLLLANSAVSALEGMTPIMEAPPSAEYLAACEQQVLVHSERLRDLDVLKASWAAASKARDGAQEADTEGENWAKLVDACTDAISKLIDHGIEGFRLKVQALLPRQDEFHITLREGDRSVFRFGLRHDGRIRTALSGAEWARVTAALAGVCTPPNRVAVIIPEDRGFDPVMLRAVLEAFTPLEGQVLFAAPVAPQGGAPAGWSVIETVSGGHRNATPPGAEGPSGHISDEAAPAVPLFSR